MPKTQVDRDLLIRVAQNARLQLSEKEIQTILPQLQEILATFEKIERVNVSKTKPAFHPVPLQNRWRNDTVTNSLSNANALKNAVHQKPPYFKGPKAIE